MIQPNNQEIIFEIRTGMETTEQFLCLLREGHQQEIDIQTNRNQKRTGKCVTTICWG